MLFEVGLYGVFATGLAEPTLAIVEQLRPDAQILCFGPAPGAFRARRARPLHVVPVAERWASFWKRAGEPCGPFPRK